MRRSRETPATEVGVGFDAACWLADTTADNKAGAAETPPDKTTIESAMVLSLGISGYSSHWRLWYDGPSL
jgi:hypothetical protein